MSYKFQNDKNRQEGYIALISAIVISILLLAITFTLSFTGFYGRYNILDSEYKKASEGLAAGCVNRAIIQIANAASVTYPDVWTIDASAGKSCTVQSVQPAAGFGVKTIKTTSNYKNAYTNYQVVVTSSTTNVVINSWKECTSSC